jgi:hypothetical protein
MELEVDLGHGRRKQAGKGWDVLEGGEVVPWQMLPIHAEAGEYPTMPEELPAWNDTWLL